MFLLTILASERAWIGFDVEPNMLSCHQARCCRQVGILDHHDGVQ